MNKIKTNRGDFCYTPIPLYYGRKIIDRDTCRDNLLDFKMLLDLKQIDFGIIFGTLLGAVREKNFIEYDEDVDVYILGERKQDFLNILFDLHDIGFDVARYDGDMISVIRKDDYIDIYFFRKNILSKRVCNSFSLSNKYFTAYDSLNFLNKSFKCPNNHIDFLEKSYGKDWRTPKRNTPADVDGYFQKFKKLINKKMPFLYKLLKKVYRFIIPIKIKSN
jgi:lipopolysaccharide cholinephosphotransferase